MAMKNKMGLSLGIAVGSSLQIGLFVAPALIFFSYLFGQPMDLEFTLPRGRGGHWIPRIRDRYRGAYRSSSSSAGSSTFKNHHRAWLHVPHRG